ncbi:MAG: plasmid recombination protein, partial [Candidatus Bathyarchaeota archaeon]|nr:plasmid recombination protein [Candidatus Termitimicrobium sp.]
MAYQIIRVAGMKKFDVAGIQIHDLRSRDVSHTNTYIDFERSSLNYDLHNGEQKINFTEVINERIRSLDLKRAVRKDANIMAQLFISASPEWFGQIDEQVQRKYFEDAYGWVCDRYGKENIISAIVHLDEATPHMHVNFVPVSNGKVCYADLFSERPHAGRGRKGGQLTTLQDDFHEHNKSKEYDLERGERGSAAEHLSVLDFKKQERAKEVAELEGLKEQALVSVSKARDTAFELRDDVRYLEEEKGKLEGQIGVLRGQLEQGQQNAARMAAVNAEYRAKKKYVESVKEASDSSVRLPDYVKITKKTFGKEEFVTVPMEKWLAKHIAANEAGFLDDMQVSLEKSMADFVKSQSGVNYQAMRNKIKGLESENVDLKDKNRSQQMRIDGY